MKDVKASVIPVSRWSATFVDHHIPQTPLQIAVQVHLRVTVLNEYQCEHAIPVGYILEEELLSHLHTC